MDQRKDKIRELKLALKTKQDMLTDTISFLIKEEDEEKKKEIKETIATIKGELTETKRLLERTRMNKYGSEFFEFVPHVGMNRRQARAFRRMRK